MTQNLHRHERTFHICFTALSGIWVQMLYQICAVTSWLITNPNSAEVAYDALWVCFKAFLLWFQCAGQMHLIASSVACI